MQLKGFQLDTLKVLGDFLANARIHGAATAYADALNTVPGLSDRLRRYKPKYKPLNGMADAPYVCLRLPTGAGKTILGAHAIKVAQENWLEREFPLVLWLVPSNTIRLQTVEALKKPGHPYREALDDAFGGAVRVFDISDFTNILPHDLQSSCVVVVATIQTLRVSNTEGRKVYAHHEMLEPHFSGVPAQAAGLERIEGQDSIRFSFANLLHLHRPLMIVDEAHNAVTGLSREMQQRVNPAAIIELTATPDISDSNVLYAVTAQEVKDAELIKLPIVVSGHETWQQAVTGAVARRSELEAVAAKDRDYIRPIVLFQAEPKDRDVTVVVLKEYLIAEGIDENRIAVATGDQRELDGINLFDANSPIDFIITVEALKEGWDCSFAYVFCSLANVKSDTAAEQLLGRVLRMPYARRRSATPLNKAYANLVSKSFMQAANDLRDALVEKFGFEESEAAQNIEAAQPELAVGLFGQQSRPLAGTTMAANLTLEQAGAVAAAASNKVAVDTGASRLTVRHFLSIPERQAVKAVLPAELHGEFDDAADTFEAENRHLKTPAEKGEDFTVPALMVEIQGELELADTDVLMENADWRLSDHPAQLSAQEFSVREEAETWEVDVSQGRLFLQQAAAGAQLPMDLPVEGWTEQALVRWLDRQVRDPNIGQADLLTWLSDAVHYLAGPRGIPLSALKQCQYILARVVREKIASIKATVRESEYQRSLFAPEAKPQLSVETGFTFSEGMFDGVPRQADGRFRFSKHFLGWDNVPAFDGAPGGAEEQCAIAIDTHPAVKHWVRNVAKHPRAFKLPLAQNWFYPDFVVELTNGRLLVVEVKGEHIAEYDRDKRAVGEMWGQLEPNRAQFLWIEVSKNGDDPHKQLNLFLSP